MVQRVTVSPSEVRGYGDIVSPKTTEDFYEYMSSLTESDGLYTLTYDDTGIHLNLTASPTTIQYGSSTVFTAVLTQAGEPVEGETVSFYDGETLLGTDATDSSGEATLTKSDFTVGSHSVRAVYDEFESSSVSVTVTKVAVTVSLSADQFSVTYGSNVGLSGVLSLGSGVTVTIYDGNTSLGTVTTGSGGAFSKTVSTPSVGSHTFRVEYGGDSTHESASASVNVTVNKSTPIISLTSNKLIVPSGDTYTLSGVLSLGSGVSVKLYKGQTLLDTLTTGTGGAFSKTITSTGDTSHGALVYKVVYEGDSTHTSVTSEVAVTEFDGSNYLELDITGNTFEHNASPPFTYTGSAYLDWGDDTPIISYTGGRLQHTYTTSGNYVIKLYGNITAINSDSLIDCNQLTSITFPPSVTTLGSYCLLRCNGLTSVVIPSTITSIGNGCFKGCTGLIELVLEWDTSSEIVSYNSTWIEDCSLFSHFLIPEGTKSLYTAKNYPSALLKEDGEPTPDSISLALTDGKQILSYADVSSGNEYATLTATVLDDNDDPVEGVSVDLYKDSVLWDTLTTGSAGTVSKTYTSAGIGDVCFKAECGSLVSEIYGIRDAKYYADYDKIKSTWTVDSSVSGRTIYNYLNNITDGTVLFKLNNLPNNFLIGLGKYYSGAQIKSMFFRNNGTNQHWYSTNSRENITRTVSQSITSNSVLKFVVSNSHTISAYVDDVLVATDTTRSSFNPTLRIDDFTATPLDLEYVIVL